jgi:carboxypeptidase C (cathepsin A)
MGILKTKIKNVADKVFFVDDVAKFAITKLKNLSNTTNAITNIKFVSSSILDDIGINVSSISKYDDYVKLAISKVKIDSKCGARKLKKYGYSIAGQILIELDESTVDDELITAVVIAAVVAAASSMTGPVGGLASGVLTKSTLTPVLSGAFKYLDKYQIKVGNKLVDRSKKL